MPDEPKTFTMKEVVEQTAAEAAKLAIPATRAAIAGDIANFETRIAAAEKFNERMEQLDDGMKTVKTALDEGLAEIRARMQRGEAYGRENDESNLFRMSAFDGRSVVPTISKGFATALHGAVSTKLDPMTERAFKRDIDLIGGGLTTAGTSPTIIPTEYMTEFLGLVKLFGDYTRLARHVPMTEKTQAYPAFDGDGVDAEWVPESGTPTNQTLPNFTDVSFTNEILMALAAIPIPYLQDARPAVQQMIAEHFARKFALAVDKSGFTSAGTGIANQEPFTGILHSTKATMVPLASGSTFESVTFQDFLNLQNALENEAIEGAIYGLNRTMFNHVQSLTDKQGRFIYREPSATEPANMFGIPVVKIRSLPKITDSAAGTPFGFLGNMYHAYMGDRIAVQIGWNENPLWANLKVLGRGYMRCATGVTTPGWFAVAKTNN